MPGSSWNIRCRALLWSCNHQLPPRSHPVTLPQFYFHSSRKFTMLNKWGTVLVPGILEEHSAAAPVSPELCRPRQYVAAWGAFGPSFSRRPPLVGFNH